MRQTDRESNFQIPRGGSEGTSPSILFIIYTQMKLVSKHVRHALSSRMLHTLQALLVISLILDTKKFSYMKCRQANNIKGAIFICKIKIDNLS